MIKQTFSQYMKSLQSRSPDNKYWAIWTPLTILSIFIILAIFYYSLFLQFLKPHFNEENKDSDNSQNKWYKGKKQNTHQRHVEEIIDIVETMESGWNGRTMFFYCSIFYFCPEFKMIKWDLAWFLQGFFWSRFHNEVKNTLISNQ